MLHRELFAPTPPLLNYQDPFIQEVRVATHGKQVAPIRGDLTPLQEMQLTNSNPRQQGGQGPEYTFVLMSRCVGLSTLSTALLYKHAFMAMR